MNGLHDMGGSQGWGPVETDPAAPLFHGDWERRVLALVLAMGAHGLWSIDRSRYFRELVPPQVHARDLYFEKWLAGLEALLLAHGVVTQDELDGSAAAAGGGQPALRADGVAAAYARVVPYTRDVPETPRFAPGDMVHAINCHPAGHTRLPRYARDKTGEVVAHRGAHVFADANTGPEAGAPAHHLYTVAFSARTLWGPDAPAGDSVTLDLWEPHLEPA